ncbi:MAG: hypothetical protein KKB51_09155 [Candidatus Riflebacteria bacterium]|nr:hypothetical protein [Candidatus Riflebacteria bacterium]
MEEIVLFLLEIFGEFILGMIFEGMTEVGGHKVKKLRQKRHAAKMVKARKYGENEVETPLDPMSSFSAMATYAVLGLFSGILSLMIFPKSFVQGADARLICLFVAPIIAGLAMTVAGRVRDQRGEEQIRLDSFFYGLLFALCYTGLRFALAK